MERRVLGVLAGEDMSLPLLAKWAADADVLLAADGGANRLIQSGHVPLEIIGDLDSADPLSLSSGALVIKDASPEYTDCDKLLELAAGKGFESVTLTSVEGDLPDHFLATLHSAAKALLRVRLALRRGVGWIVKPEAPITVGTQPGRRLSFLPLSECRAVRLHGVHWELAGADLHPSGLSSISNRTASDSVTAELGSGAAFLFIEYPAEEIPFW